MASIIEGERIGRKGRLAVGCSAAVFDDEHEHILLIRRADNGRWAVPGGYMEPGETMTEACVREVFEETGLRVGVKRLIAVYTNPHLLIEYPDGNRLQLVILYFQADYIAGNLRPSDESPTLQYFSLSEAAKLDTSPLDRCRIQDAFLGQEVTLIRDEF